MHRTSCLALAAAALLLVSCQPEGGRPTVSLEEAKKVAAEFKGQSSFVPPPRSIADITAVLDQYKPDPTKVAALSSVADARPPEGEDKAGLARFFFRRSQAAYELGRVRQQLDDIRAAVRNQREAGLDDERYRTPLMVAEISANNFRNALKVAEAYLNLPESERRKGSTASFFAWAGHIKLMMGDTDGGEDSLRDAEAMLDDRGFRRWSAYDTVHRHYRSTVRRTRGRLEEETGKYAEAERSYRTVLDHVRWLKAHESEVRAVFARLSPNVYEVKRWLVRLDLARILKKQGRLIEAEAEARRVLLDVLGIQGRYTAKTAMAIAYLANIVYEQGRLDDALKLTEAALDIHRRLGAGVGSYGVARLHTLRARILLRRRDTAGALAAWSDARSVFADDAEQRRHVVESSVDYGLTLLIAGRHAEALPVIEKIVADRRRTLGDKHYETAEARGFLAMALARAGETDRALKEFRAAVPLLMQTSRRSGDVTGSGEQERRRRVVFEAYIRTLTRLKPGRNAGFDPVAEAFRVADAARAGNVQRALSASAARGAVRDPDLARLVREEQDAQKQIAARFGLLSNSLSSPPDQQDAGSVDTLRKSIDRLRGARAALREEIERRFPDYAALIDPRPARLAEAQKLLHAGEALVSIYVGEEETYVWAVPKDGRAAFAAVPLGQDRLAAAVRDLRRALDPNAATLGKIPAYDVALAHRLYKALLQPVAAGLEGVDSLLIVPHKALAQLPFALLVTQASAPPNDSGGALFSGYKHVPFLVRKVAVTQLPSVTALASLRKVAASAGKRQAFVGFGDPWFTPAQAELGKTDKVVGLRTRGLRTRSVPLVRRSVPATQSRASADIGVLPRLPDTAEEVRSVARALHADPATDVFLGRDASEQKVKSADLSHRRIVMFATHGLVPGDLNGLTQPALALSAPSVTGGSDDGLLTMEEILGLRLNADWVVLSACNTAAAAGAGAEAVSGLGRAFFYAGTRALLVSNWPVETSSARALTTDLFRRQAAAPKLPRSEAMRQAMLALIDGPGFRDERGRTVFSYAHPIFWAPFSVVGDGGGATVN